MVHTRAGRLRDRAPARATRAPRAHATPHAARRFVTQSSAARRLRPCITSRLRTQIPPFSFRLSLSLPPQIRPKRRMFVARPTRPYRPALRSLSSAAAPWPRYGQPDPAHYKRDGALVGHRVRMEYGLWCRPDLDVAGARANFHPDHLVDGGGSDNCTTDLLAQARRVHAAGVRLHGADARHDCHRPRPGRPQVGHGPLQGIHRFRDGHAISFCWRAKVLRQVCVLRGGILRGSVLRGRLVRSARPARHPGVRNRAGLQLPANR
jgi:hypothetical protein